MASPPPPSNEKATTPASPASFAPPPPPKLEKTVETTEPRALDQGTGTTTTPKNTWRRWHTIGLLVLTTLLFLLCYEWIPAKRLGSWWGAMLLLTIAALLIGHGITGYWRGILIDERNKMSLARLQLAMWTVIIVSAVLVLFFWRLFAKVEGPLDITIPEQIWALLGISTTSLVGSSLIKTNKKNQSPNLEEEQETGRRVSDQGVDPSDLRVTGRVVLNESASMASWADLFRGEESGNATAVSLGKFQMFYFTLIAVVSYGYALAEMFGANTPAAGFPAVSSGLLTLLGISHGGYLAEKAVPHTQEPASQPLPTPAQGAMVAAAPAPITVVRQIRRAARPLGQP